MRSRTKAVLGLAAVVVVAVGSYLIGSQTESESQRAANAAPVQRTLLTEPVRQRQLTSSLVFRATVDGAPVRKLSEFPALDENEDAVVTDVRIKTGSTLRGGRAAIAVAGHPVLALPGSLPSYRDMGVGDSGPDVRQLQRALIELGFGADAASGRFGEQTADAVASLWRRNGFTAPTRPGASPKRPARAYVAKHSIVYLPRLPATVSSVGVRRGSLLAGNSVWASVHSGSPTVTARIPAASAGQVAVGARVRLYDDATGAQATAVVASLAAPADGSDGAGQVVPARLRIVGTLPFEGGIDLRAVAVTRSTGRAVLSVPVVAVHTGEDGSSYVTVVSGSRRTDVKIRPGLVAGGYVAVLSASPALRGGDRVVVSE